MEFEFVGDHSFQSILKRDFKEVQKCIEVGANKAAIILSGSILETILTDYFSENLPPEKTKDSILKLSLNSLLELAVQTHLISSSDNSLATVLKTYRNLIHPGREVRSAEDVDNNTAKLAFSILELLLEKIEKKYKEHFIHGVISFSAGHFGGKNLNIEMDVLEQILNSLSIKNKEAALQYLSDIILPHKDSLPASVELFAQEAVKRGLISFD